MLSSKVFYNIKDYEAPDYGIQSRHLLEISKKNDKELKLMLAVEFGRSERIYEDIQLNKKAREKLALIDEKVESYVMNILNEEFSKIERAYNKSQKLIEIYEKALEVIKDGKE